MPDDAGITEASFDIGQAEPCNQGGIEPGESRPEVVSLAEDGQPRQAGLASLQADLLDEIIQLEFNEYDT